MSPPSFFMLFMVFLCHRVVTAVHRDEGGPRSCCKAKTTRLRFFVQTISEQTNSSIQVNRFPLGGPDAPQRPGVPAFAAVFNSKLTQSFQYSSTEIGRYTGTVFQASPTDFYAAGNILLYGRGNLTVQGLLFSIPITGGSDSFNRAEGNVTFTILLAYGLNNVAVADATIVTPA